MSIVRKRKSTNWDSVVISEKLTQHKVENLKKYYQLCHRKAWAHKHASKRFKRLGLLGNGASIVLGAGGITSAIGGGLPLAAISLSSILIQMYMRHKNIDQKIRDCSYIYQSYEHILLEIKNMLNSDDYHDDDEIKHLIERVEIVAIDLAPPVDEHLKKYDSLFVSD